MELARPIVGTNGDPDETAPAAANARAPDSGNVAGQPDATIEKTGVMRAAACGACWQLWLRVCREMA